MVAQKEPLRSQELLWIHFLPNLGSADEATGTLPLPSKISMPGRFRRRRHSKDRNSTEAAALDWWV